MDLRNERPIPEDEENPNRGMWVFVLSMILGVALVLGLATWRGVLVL